MAEKDQLEGLPEDLEVNVPDTNNIDQYNAAVEAATPEPEEVSQAVQKASADGWAPLDQWRGDPAEWVDAEEFNRRGPIMRQVREQKSKLSQIEKDNAELKQALATFQELNNKIIEKDYNTILDNLKEQRAEAITSGYGTLVNEIDDKIDAFKAEQASEAVREKAIDEDNEPVQYPPEFHSFAERNTWYATEDRVTGGANVDWEMTQFTDTLGEAFYKQAMADGRPEPTAAEAVQHIESRLRQIFPDRFQDTVNTNVQQHNTSPQIPTITEPTGEVSANTRDMRGGSKVTINDLPVEQRAVIQRMAESSGLTVQDYVDQLTENGLN
jgi:hypothetical protein